MKQCHTDISPKPNKLLIRKLLIKLLKKFELKRLTFIKNILTLENFIFSCSVGLSGNVLTVDGLRTGSTAGMPTRDNKSDNIADFNLTSNGLSQFNEGERFTSNSHGFKFLSISISKPNSSETKLRPNSNWYYKHFIKLILKYFWQHCVIEEFSNNSVKSYL